MADQDAFVLAPYLRGFGPTRFLEDTTIRSGQQAALGQDLIDFMDALTIEKAIVAGYDWGGRAACIAAALAPGRVAGLVSVGGYNMQNLARAGEPAIPEWERTYWYQYYFHSERGRRGLDRTATNSASCCGAPGHRRGLARPMHFPPALRAFTTPTSLMS